MPSRNNAQVSIIIPTYNESENIIQVLQSIGENLPKNTPTEAIVVDDNSPDGTGKLVEDYLKNLTKIADYTINVIHRKAKNGLSSAILKGIQHSQGDTIVVMDSDFSHPAQIIPKMVESLRHSKCDIVIASRYLKDSYIKDWTRKRKLLSKIAIKIAKKGLGITESDPMSGFFAFKRHIINGLKFDAIGYKMLLEILVKTKGVHVLEIPFTFTNRQLGSSKLNISTIIDYANAVGKLYHYGRSIKPQEPRTSVRFLSKAGRFYTVGASGVAVNYLTSLMFVTGIVDLWYVYANVIGIIFSMSTNFVLNKTWTFEDRDFSLKKTLGQYGKFISFSSLGAVVQLSIVYLLVDTYSVVYPLALVLAVITASFGNFILNKKWTFKERVWD